MSFFLLSSEHARFLITCSTEKEIEEYGYNVKFCCSGTLRMTGKNLLSCMYQYLPYGNEVLFKLWLSLIDMPYMISIEGEAYILHL